MLIGPFAFNLSAPVSGEVECTIDSAVTEVIRPGKWPYDMEYDDGSGVKKRLFEGYVQVVPQVTAAT